MLNLSQQDYVNRINELNQALISSWDQDQKVKALKIAIQVSTAYILGSVKMTQAHFLQHLRREKFLSWQNVSQRQDLPSAFQKVPLRIETSSPPNMFVSSCL